MTLHKRLLEKVSVNASTGCWEWTASKIWSGYGQIRVDGKTVYAHRASYEVHCGHIPDGMKVLHCCDNPPCINPKHLFLGTQGDNSADKLAKNRQARGISQGQSKLTENDVFAIRAAQGISLRQLATRHGVSSQQISTIRAGKQWRHLLGVQ